MKISSIAKYVDQPLIINKISNAAPAILGGCAVGLGVHDVFIQKHKPQEPKKNRLIKNAVVLGTVSAASLVSARGLTVGGKKIFTGLIETASKSDILKEQQNAIGNFTNDTGRERHGGKHYARGGIRTVIQRNFASGRAFARAFTRQQRTVSLIRNGD